MVAIALLSRSKSFFIAGLVPLFPTFSLVAHVVVGTERSAKDLQVTALFGLYSLAPYILYLLTVYWLCTRFPLAATLTLATLVWMVAAGILLVVWTRFYSGVL